MLHLRDVKHICHHHYHDAFWGFGANIQTFHSLRNECNVAQTAFQTHLQAIGKTLPGFTPSHPVKTLPFHIKSLRGMYKCANSDGNVSHSCNILKDPLLSQWFELVRTVMLMHKNQISVTWKHPRAAQAELTLASWLGNAFFMRGF